MVFSGQCPTLYLKKREGLPRKTCCELWGIFAGKSETDSSMSTHMKIIHFHPNGKSAAVFVTPLVQAERNHGHESEIITSVNPISNRAPVIPYDLNIRNIPGIIFAFAKICSAISKRKPDIVISHNTKSSVIPLLAAWAFGTKSRIYYNHGVPFVGYRGPLRWTLKFLEMLNCSLATEIISVSADMRQLLLTVKPSAKISIIGNGSACGIDLNVFNAEIYVNSTFKYRNNIANNDFVVAFIGRPERRKGFDLVIKLWCSYFTDPRYKLVLCGPRLSDILKITPSLPPNVICLGFTKNIPEVLSNADCLILPSLHEGLPYAALEAMACGCIVVASNVDGTRSLVHHGVNGYLVDGNTIANYAEALKVLENRGNELVDIKSRGMETARRYDRSIFMSSYVQFIRRVGG